MDDKVVNLKVYGYDYGYFHVMVCFHVMQPYNETKFILDSLSALKIII